VSRGVNWRRRLLRLWGWTVFRMPTGRTVSEARPIGIVRLRSGGSSESGCLAELRAGRQGFESRKGAAGAAGRHGWGG
jgi:hypothetical protein